MVSVLFSSSSWWLSPVPFAESHSCDLLGSQGPHILHSFELLEPCCWRMFSELGAPQTAYCHSYGSRVYVINDNNGLPLLYKLFSTFTTEFCLLQAPNAYSTPEECFFCLGSHPTTNPNLFRTENEDMGSLAMGDSYWDTSSWIPGKDGVQGQATWLSWLIWAENKRLRDLWFHQQLETALAAG